MALTITHAGATWNTTAGNKTVVATPAANDLIVVIAASSGLAGGTTDVTDTQGGVYEQVDVGRTGFSTTGVLTAWVRKSPIPAASSTTFTALQSGSSGGGLSVFRIAGALRAGASAIRSTGGQSSGTSGTTPAPVLSQAPLTGNAIIMAVCNGTNSSTTVVPRTNFTEANDLGYNSPATGFETCFRNSGETTATQTFGGTTASTFASIALEIDASALPSGPVHTPIRRRMASRFLTWR